VIGRGADGRVGADHPGPTGALRAHAGPPANRPAVAFAPEYQGRKPAGYDIKEVVVRDVAPVDTAEVTALLASTIGQGPVGCWLAPDVMVRQENGPAYFEIFVEHAIHHGEIYANVDPGTGDLVGVALWFPLIRPIPPPRDYDLRLKDACGEAFDRARDLDAALEAHHPLHPHHYLAFIAVRPDRQNLGIGSALLARHHARIDAAGIPAYLEANDRRNRDLYLRHGYVVESMIQLPDGGPPIWPMRRDPMTLRRTDPVRTADPARTAELVVVRAAAPYTR
jgi:GNAT superfamily N-acetyltransferase